MRKINEEIKEQEGRKIRRESERMLQEDQDIGEAKRIAGRKLLTEILKANDDAQEARIKAKEFEKEEEARRQVYVHEKEKRDLAYQEAQDKIKQEREMETARQAELKLDVLQVCWSLGYYMHVSGLQNSNPTVKTNAMVETRIRSKRIWISTCENIFLLAQASSIAREGTGQTSCGRWSSSTEGPGRARTRMEGERAS
ncbi:hypothetical protein Mapa_005032 [Marchantia paleacea]|nr:hypothetical protein Mapa_005032 [Marchantia paleacea]